MNRASIGVKTPAFAAVPTGAIRVGPMLAIPRLLAAKGIAIGPILDALRLPRSVFDDPDLAIPLAVVGALLVRCADAAQDAHFGLHVGQLAGPSSLGVSGIVVQHSPDVGTALRNLERHLALHDRGGVVTVAIADDVASLVYGLPQSDAPGLAHVMAGAMAIGCNLMRAVCGDAWAAREVQLAFRKPADVEPYRRFFRAPVRFDADVCALAFPAATLKQPVMGADTALYRILEREVRDVSSRVDAPFGERLGQLVRSAMATGDVSLERVASLLSMRPRTLNRRLQQNGTTFKQIAGEARFAMSQQMLGRSDMRLSDIAASLGYADASAFTRAFRRWSGVTPTDWRRRHGGTDAGATT